jgi:RNA polymerase sigma-70 factor (ECF subfamily)
LGDVDSASSQPGDLVLSLESASPASSAPEVTVNAAVVYEAIRVHEAIPEALAEELWFLAEGRECGMTQMEFSAALVAVGKKCNHGLAAPALPDSLQREAFYRALRLPDFALAQACALGREAAWQRFLALYRGPVTQSAIAITKSSSLGNDLADSLYSELFGLKDRDGYRISPLASYSGRGSLLSWLRSTLAQRHFDHHRRTHREAPLETVDVPAAASTPTPLPEELSLLSGAVARTLKALDSDDCFLLSSYYLDRHTLLDIARLLKVHEATISRRLKRLIGELHKQLLMNLRAAGLSERKAQETLGADPRDIEINLRRLLQTSRAGAFTEQAKQIDLDPR